MQKIFTLIAVCLTATSLCSIPELPSHIIYDYCTDRIDQISETLTHGIERDLYERTYLYGEIDAFHEILYIIEN